MQRTWAIRPDETGLVSREALISAFIDAAALLDIAGGTLSVVTGRTPTNVPGEMALNGVVLTWMDRTNAKPQPEAPSTVTTASDYLGESDRVVNTRTGEELTVTKVGPEDGFKYEPTEENPDGFDHDRLEEEDVEEAPEVVR